MKAISREFRDVLPWELLYADDLVMIAESEVELTKKLMNIGDGARLESVDKFCYLSNMLTVDGDADAAVEARVCKGRNKFRQLEPLLPLRMSHFL